VLEQLATWQGHARPVFFIRGKTEAPKTHSRVGVLGEGATTRFPPAIGVWGSAVNSPSGVPEGFPLFSALRMASPDTIMLLIVDYHAATGGQDPCDSLCVHRCNLVEINS